MKQKIDHFSHLFREIEAEIGTRDLADLLLKALIESITSFKGEHFKEFCSQFDDLVNVVASTEPKFGILIYHFLKLQKDFHGNYCSKLSDTKWKRVILKRVKEILKDARAENKKLIEYSEKIDVEGKTILIHDNSHTVHDVLSHYKRMGKHFRVIIAEQDFEKTHNNIERMYKIGIPFQVVPAYMLSHVHENIDMVFFGALTLKDTMNFVMNPGTHGIISEFHVEGIPIYMFINSKKFSLWRAEKKLGVFMHKHKRQHHARPIEYERIKYSHDRVPCKMFTKIVTNDGFFTPAELEKFFEGRMKKYCFDDIKESV